MNDIAVWLVVVLVFLIMLFFIFRELNNWYWKINERISMTHNTNFLLEMIAAQLGVSETDVITIEEIKTGKIKKVKMNEWIEFRLNNGDSSSFRTIKNTNISSNFCTNCGQPFNKNDNLYSCSNCGEKLN